MIAVTGVSIKTYSITTQRLSGLTISTSDNYNVTPGGSFTFKLSFVSSIDPTTISVKVNSQPITGSNWTYTLNNIQSDKEITLTQIRTTHMLRMTALSLKQVTTRQYILQASAQ
jgi:hypothetical protein